MFLFLFAGPALVAAAVAYSWHSGPGGWSLEMFTGYLEAVVRRNLPLGSSLKAFARDLPGWRYGKRDLVLRVADAVENGSSLADALDRESGRFPLTYRALVRAGERGGNVGRVLGYLREYVAGRSLARRRAAGYAMYPAALVLVAVNIFAVVIVVVLPKFYDMIAEMAAAVPLSLRLVAGAADLVADFWYLLALAAVVTYAFLSAAGLGPTKAPYSSWVSWRLPFFSRYERRRAVAQYALAASRLMEAGVPTQEALEVSASASGNQCFERIALAAAERTAEGTALSEALKAADARRELPREFAWYVEVGERSGDLPGALMAASKSAAARSESALSHMVGLILPAGVLVVGFFVGALGYAMFDTFAVMMEMLAQ